jgi:hypothetical protein
MPSKPYVTSFSSHFRSISKTLVIKLSTISDRVYVYYTLPDRIPTQDTLSQMCGITPANRDIIGEDVIIWGVIRIHVF